MRAGSERTSFTPPQSSAFLNRSCAVETAEAAARDLRRQLGLPPAPIWDLLAFAERLGCYAFCLDLKDESLDGSYLRLEAGGVAVVNGSMRPGRRRFTLAHELGHLRNLELVDQRTHDSLRADRPTKADYLEGGVTLREELTPPAVPPKYAQAVVRAFKRHKLSRGRTLELLRGAAVDQDLPREDLVPLEAMRSQFDLD